jgi:hypothetical protein
VIGTSLDGSLTVTVPDWQVGCNITITYTATQSSTGAKASDTVSYSVPAPTVSLTANGSHSITVKTDDSITYTWKAFTGADRFSSSYASSPDSPAVCGSGTWIANSASGSGTYTALAWQEGCNVTVTYTATQSSTGIKASDTITVKFVSPTSASNSSQMASVGKTGFWNWLKSLFGL